MTLERRTPFQAGRYDLGDELTLSPVAPGEIAELAGMLARMKPWLGYPGISEASLSAFLAEVEPGAPRFALRRREAILGTLTVRTNWFRGPYIQLFAVAPSSQSQGLGGRMLAFVETEARRSAERQIWVAATRSNTGAVAFYERHGYVRVAEIDGLVADGIVELLLRKRL